MQVIIGRCFFLRNESLLQGSQSLIHIMLQVCLKDISTPWEGLPLAQKTFAHIKKATQRKLSSVPLSAAHVSNSEDGASDEECGTIILTNILFTGLLHFWTNMDPNQNCFPYFSQYYSRNAEVLGSLVLECRAPTSPPTWNRSIQECGSVLPPQISRTIPNRRFFRPVHQQEGVANFDHLYKIHQLLCLDQNQHSVSKPLTPHSWERGRHVPLPLGTTHQLLYGTQCQMTMYWVCKNILLSYTTLCSPTS